MKKLRGNSNEESTPTVNNILQNTYTVNGVKYGPISYVNNKRLSSTTGGTKDMTGVCIIGPFPASKDFTYYIKPVSAKQPTSNTVGAWCGCLYTNNGATLTEAGYLTVGGAGGGTLTQSGDVLIYHNSTDRYASICFECADGATLTMTCNQELT